MMVKNDKYWGELRQNREGVTKKIFLEMANQNYLLTLRFLCVFVSSRLRNFHRKGAGAQRFRKESRAYLVKCFHAILFSQPLNSNDGPNLPYR